MNSFGKSLSQSFKKPFWRRPKVEQEPPETTNPFVIEQQTTPKEQKKTETETEIKDHDYYDKIFKSVLESHKVNPGTYYNPITERHYSPPKYKHRSKKVVPLEEGKGGRRKTVKNQHKMSRRHRKMRGKK